MEPKFEALMKIIPGGDNSVQQLKIIFPTVSVGNMVNVTNSDKPSTISTNRAGVAGVPTRTTASVNHDELHNSPAILWFDPKLIATQTISTISSTRD